MTSAFYVAAISGTAFATIEGIVHYKGHVGPKIIPLRLVVHALLSWMTGQREIVGWVKDLLSQ